MPPETAEEPIALFNVFCGFPTISRVGPIVDTKLFSLTYLHQRNTLPTDWVSVAVLHEISTHTETMYS